MNICYQRIVPGGVGRCYGDMFNCPPCNEKC